MGKTLTCPAPTTLLDVKHGSLIPKPAHRRNEPPWKKLAGVSWSTVIVLKAAVISSGECK
ncbi:hypothetical protein Bca52824_082870 [Brassica carinata]|uniref:Uncharacterized protein n=1 Tax=Brassica carinata TaxID=52824 RepID=A0A8X7TT07_BRACI|nr:hypothetical protein Bca52824_082870 [Brassica carinata]